MKGTRMGISNVASNLKRTGGQAYYGGAFKAMLCKTWLHLSFVGGVASASVRNIRIHAWRKAQCDAAWAIPSVSVSQKHLAACGYRDSRSRMLAPIETYVCAVWVELPVFCATMQVTAKASGQGAKAREEVEVKGGSPMYLNGRLK